MRNCETCLYRDDCADTCYGYVEDDETSSARADYMELQADIERDENC